MMAAVKRVFSEGFRVFFLFAGLYGAFVGIVWVLWLGVHAAGGMMEMPSQAMPPYQWHAHEMIFGFAAAAVGGFFLTAVPSWTNTPGARIIFIAVASGLWLAGRLALWISADLPGWVVAAVDLAFVPVLAVKILSQLVKRPKPQNMMFLLFLAGLWVGNLMVHLDWLGVTDDSLAAGLRVGLVTLCGLIAVLGGRITPAFTRNAMKRAGLPESGWPAARPGLDRAVVALALALPWLVALPLGDRVQGAAALALGAAQALRMTGWRSRWTLGQPILLSLHVGLAMLALGLVLWGAALWGLGSEVAALHVLGIGCVGSMTLAVMSRAALGHSGRDLVAPRPVALAYGLMAAAAALRWVGSGLAGGWYFPASLAAGALWVAAFALFVAALWPVLTGPRAA